MDKISNKIYFDQNIKNIYSNYYDENISIWTIINYDENLYKDYLIDELHSFIVTNILDMNKYKETIFNKLFKKINKFILEIKNDNEINDDKGMNLLIIISDYNSILVALTMGFKIEVIRNDDKFKEIELKEGNLIGINNYFNLGILTEPFILNKKDIIKITLNNELIIDVLINEINKFSLYKKKKKNKYIFVIIFFLLITLYIYINNYTIKNSFNKYYELDEKLLVSKLEDKSQILIEKSNILKNLDKKYIYLSKNNIIKRQIEINNLNVLKLEYMNIMEIIKTEDFIKREIKIRNFSLALDKYKEIYEKIKNYNSIFLDYKIKIKKHIEELEKLKENKNYEDDFVLDDENIVSSIKKFKEILKIYQKSSYDINVKDLKEIEKGYNEVLNDLSLRINEMIVKSEVLKENDLLKSKEEYLKIKELLVQLNNNTMILEVESAIKEIEEEIKYLYDEVKKNIYEAENEYESNNFEGALTYYIQAKEYLKKLNEKEKIKEINSKIRIINKKMNKSDGYINSSKMKNYMIKTIKLSITKGDELLKSNLFDKALIEYTRALEIIDEIKYDENVRNKTIKKIEYIKNKDKKKWWNIWN